MRYRRQHEGAAAHELGDARLHAIEGSGQRAHLARASFGHRRGLDRFAEALDRSCEPRERVSLAYDRKERERRCRKANDAGPVSRWQAKNPDRELVGRLNHEHAAARQRIHNAYRPNAQRLQYGAVVVGAYIIRPRSVCAALAEIPGHGDLDPGRALQRFGFGGRMRLDRHAQPRAIGDTQRERALVRRCTLDKLDDRRDLIGQRKSKTRIGRAAPLM
jgi:hypothetical protein